MLMMLNDFYKTIDGSLIGSFSADKFGSSCCQHPLACIISRVAPEPVSAKQPYKAQVVQTAENIIEAALISSHCLCPSQ